MGQPLPKASHLMNTPDVSVIIVSWNCLQLLRDCLASISSQAAGLSLEVFVVDNASKDGTVEMLSREFPDVIVIANKENRGFAAANNQALAIARAPYLLLLNPDTVILDHAIEKTVRFADENPDVGIVGPRVLENESRVQRTCFSFQNPWNVFLVESGLHRIAPHSRILGAPELGWWNRDCMVDVDVVSGMYMLVRRTAMQQVGLLDEAFFVYGEEADWCRRFSRAGWRRVFIPQAEIIHRDGGSKSTEQVSVRMFVQMQKSTLIYQRKHHGRLGYWSVKSLLILSNFMRALTFSIAGIGHRHRTASERFIRYRAALAFHILGIQPR